MNSEMRANAEMILETGFDELDDPTEVLVLCKRAMQAARGVLSEQHEIARLGEMIAVLEEEKADWKNVAESLKLAIVEHHAQLADDDRLYAAAGLPPCDRRAGSKEELLDEKGGEL